MAHLQIETGQGLVATAVGHREQLMEGAKRCLAEKGYLRTTARDIVAASGTNLASIGYHFGSKDALLTEAMIETLGQWGDEVGRVGLASIFLAVPDEQIDEQTAHTVGSFLLAVIPGLFSQWSMEPGSAPDGRSIAEGLRQIMELIRLSEAPPGEERGSAASQG